MLKFLDGTRLVPGQRMTLLEAIPYLGVMQVETEVDRVSIGYDVARQIVGAPSRLVMTTIRRRKRTTMQR